MADLDRLTPREIVAELDKYIIGQKKAKRAVAVALRNRIRRLKLPQDVRDDIAPKNILMIGPTGVGKTEIARRLAKLSGAPFLKVEATKYTEVGYVGRDVESMIRDLMAAGVQMVKEEMREGVREEAERRAEEALLDLLLPGSAKKPASGGGILGSIFGGTAAAGGQGMRSAAVPELEAAPAGEGTAAPSNGDNASAADSGREKLRAMLRAGKLDERTVEVTVQQQAQMPSMEILGGGNMEDLESSLSGIANIFGGGKKKKVVSVKRAREILIAEEAEKLVDRDRVSEEARRRVQETGIVFLDEIDKIASRGERAGGADVSREGVQRDILPIVEGSTVNTRWGSVDTSHILFIAAGAFNVSKPSDLIPELQGRFPLRVELEALGKDDFVRILTEPKNALTKQYADLLGTEGVEIEFSPDAIERLSSIAAEVNSRLENIGARRLHTIMEALLEELSFEAPDVGPQKVPITAAYVDQRLAGLVQDQDLGRYIL
jgi:ATP-dependent HslUV protease ATP-binding subunit HslU